jgi:putative ABC transport system permease protein
MKFPELFNLSIRNYKIRPLRTFLTVLGVGVGIGTVLFLVALGYGIQNLILSRISTSDALLSMQVSPGTSGFIQLNEQSLDKIKNLEGVDSYSPVVSAAGQVTLGDITGDGLVLGVTDSYFSMSGSAPYRGEFFSDTVDGVVISSGGSLLLGQDAESVIGDEISLILFVPYIGESGFEEIDIIQIEKTFTIVGVVDDMESNYLFVPFDDLNVVGFDSYSQLFVKVNDSEQMPIVRNQIVEMGYLVSSLSDVIEQANKIFGIVQIILAMFGLIALVVSAIGMFNTMTISLLERINEIGIMRSIGAASSDIRLLFLLESVIMGFAGGVGGVIVGFIGGGLANIGINILASSFGGQAVNLFYFPVWFVLFIIIFSTVIGFLTGVYPAKRASKLNPLDALRYK